jgi:hypothetical protein
MKLANKKVRKSYFRDKINLQHYQDVNKTDYFYTVIYCNGTHGNWSQNISGTQGGGGEAGGGHLMYPLKRLWKIVT